MIDIEQIQSGDAILITESGLSTSGTILNVDKETQSFLYATVDGESDTIRLEAAENSRVPGNVYDVHRHDTGLVVAHFKSWQSGKYYADNDNK